VALVDAMRDEALAGELDALADLCGAEYQLQRFLQVEGHARRGLALARASGRGDLFPWLSLTLSGVLFSTGRLVAARELIDGLVEAARLSDNMVGLASVLVNSAAVSLVAGDVENATEAAQEAVALTRGVTPSVVRDRRGGTPYALTVAATPGDRVTGLAFIGGREHAARRSSRGRRSNLLGDPRPQLSRNRVAPSRLRGGNAHARAAMERRLGPHQRTRSIVGWRA
jgi:hypothetical protein